MSKQTQTSDEDYLDQLLNSVMDSSESNRSSDIFDDVLSENTPSLDEDFFNDIEKGWIREDEKRRSMTPEYQAQESLLKNMRKEKPEIKTQAFDSDSENEEEVAESAGTGESKEPADDMQGLYDILGVNEDSLDEIEELEKSGKKKKKQKAKKEKSKKSKKGGLFGRKKKSADGGAVDAALNLMEQSVNSGEDSETSDAGADREEEESFENPLIPEGFADDGSENTDAVQDHAEGTEDAFDGLGLDQLMDQMGQMDSDADQEPEKNPTPDRNQNMDDPLDMDGMEEEDDPKDKKKKEKKKKEKKPKKEKKKKEKKPKPPKPPREPDEILAIPLPFLFFMLSLGILIVLAAKFGGTYTVYQRNVSAATNDYVSQRYADAYDKLLDLDIKKDDEYFYGQVQTVMYVYGNYQAYEQLLSLKYYEDALDSLLNGVRMFDKYKDIGREKYNCFEDMNQVMDWIIKALNDIYGINESQAREINLLGRGRDYSYKVAELALAAKERNTETDDSDH